ncbi:BfmA/BtgA family mobilization protein [Pedobacter sp. P26]|uniref:BfmA/BtgA family mobilization protein n=1 Tax=Pedobacter sp. P26 TaxID=3423956 RepID=UPI003D666A54
MEDTNIRSVRFSVAVDAKFEKIAVKLSRTKRLLFIQMVDYFYKSKKDPMDLNDDLLKNTLVKNHQQYISFIRAQENMLLLPIKAEVDRVSRSQRDIIERFNSEILKHNALVLGGQKSHTLAIGGMEKTLALLLKKTKDADVLKAQFLFYLRNMFWQGKHWDLRLRPGKNRNSLPKLKIRFDCFKTYLCS